MRALVQMIGSESAVASCLHDSKKIIAPASTYPFLLAKVAEKSSLLVITSSSRSAEDLASELRELHPSVLEFPAWETLPHERLSPRSDTVARRLATLADLAMQNIEKTIVVAPIRAVIHRFIAGLASQPLQSLEIGSEVDLTTLITNLTELAYTRTDLVEKRGEFAVRGGIVDLFLPLSEHPVRIDFFGDEIEELSYFDVASQRTTSPVIGQLTILPCRELLLTSDIRKRAESAKSKYPAAFEILDRVAQGISTEGMESLIPILVDETETIFQRMPKGTEVIYIDDERIRMRTIDLLATNEEFFEAAWSHAALGATAPLPVTDETYLSWDALTEEIARCKLSSRALNPFGSDLDKDATFLDFQAIDPLRADMDRAINALQSAVDSGFSIIFSAAGQGMAERYAGIFRNADLPVVIVPELRAIPTKASVHITQSAIAHGFTSHSARILFITERDLTGSKASAKDGARMPSKRKQAVDPLELRAGDFVVHEQHGIGRYVEMVQRSIGGVTREYLVIEYAPAKRGQPGDRVFVPTDTLEQVSKYIGGESPTVHRIGSGEWQKAKGRARKAVKQIAGELIRLYAARTSSPGFAFSPDTPWQRELEDAFSYIETPDQLSTIEEVKRDMEKPYPMDRIICGDVGYAKLRLQYVRHLKRCKMASKSPFWYRQRSWCNSTRKLLPSAMPDSHYGWPDYRALTALKNLKIYWPNLLLAALMLLLVHTACYRKM